MGFWRLEINSVLGLWQQTFALFVDLSITSVRRSLLRTSAAVRAGELDTHVIFPTSSMGIDGTEFASAAAMSDGVSPARAIHVLALDRCSPPMVITAASRLVSSMFNAAAEICGDRDAFLLLSVGGAPADDRVIELLSTVSPHALRDPRSEKTCIARLKQLCLPQGGVANTPESSSEYADRIIDRVSAFVTVRFNTSPVHLYIASMTVATVSSAADIPLNAFPSSSVCRTMHLIAGGSERDVRSLFGEVFARVLSSRVTLRVGKSLLQLVARPRICGVGFLPSFLSLSAYRRVAIQALPEDVLFGLPTALIPDDDAEQDTASIRDAEAYSRIASELHKRQEALVAVERNGPHLVLLPTSPSMILLREVASKQTLLPAPISSVLTTPSAFKSAVNLCLAGASAWNLTNEIIDDVVLSTFNPLDLDGGTFTSQQTPRVVEFTL